MSTADSPSAAGRASRGAGVLLVAVVALSVACVALRHGLEAERWSKNDRHHLPGFDAFVYVAMAEAPEIFTVAPWGYRLASPWLARTLSPDDVVPGFQWLTLIALSAAGPLLYRWLRARGHPPAAGIVATLAFYWSPPADAVFFNGFLAEPIGAVLMLWLLIALEGRAPRGSLALALTFGALTKDVFLLFLPGVGAALVARWGFRSGAKRFVLVALPACAAAMSLRLAWPVSAGEATAPITATAVVAAIGRIVAAAGDWWAPLLACGLPLSLVGAARPAGRELLRSHGLLLATTLALPFAAAVYTGAALPAPLFYADDVPRLLMYALPLLFSLALHAFSPLPPARSVSATAGPLRRRLAAAAWAGAALSAALPLLVLDSYRREDLRGRNDGHLVLAFCRQSRAFARRLGRGRLVVYEPEGRRYLRGSSDPVHMERMRWFLREGWGPTPHYGMGRVVMREPAAALIVPCFEPRDLVMAIQLSAREAVAVRLEMNDRPLATLEVGPEAPRQRVDVPASSLFRGDNRLRLRAEPGAEVRLELLNLRLRES